jgi:hypothetical protein
LKSKVITTLLASIGLFVAAGAAQAQTAGERVYVIDQRGEVVMSGAGLCWRTGYLDTGRCGQGPGRLQVRQGSAPEGSLRADGRQGCPGCRTGGQAVG